MGFLWLGNILICCLWNRTHSAAKHFFDDRQNRDVFSPKFPPYNIQAAMPELALIGTWSGQCLGLLGPPIHAECDGAIAPFRP